jgi:hypothetical protein
MRVILQTLEKKSEKWLDRQGSVWVFSCVDSSLALFREALQSLRTLVIQRTPSFASPEGIAKQKPFTSRLSVARE